MFFKKLFKKKENIDCKWLNDEILKCCLHMKIIKAFLINSYLIIISNETEIMNSVLELRRIVEHLIKIYNIEYNLTLIDKKTYNENRNNYYNNNYGKYGSYINISLSSILDLLSKPILYDIKPNLMYKIQLIYDCFIIITYEIEIIHKGMSHLKTMNK